MIHRHTWTPHPGLTRVEAFGVIYLKSNLFWSVLQQSLNLRICLFYTFSFKTHMPPKKYLSRKTNKLGLMGQIVIESHNFLKY